LIAGSAKRILIAPLDWGLGHTTRCVPLIRRLISLQCEVVFAGNDTQQTFVHQLFPDQEFRYLKGYNVRYGKGKVLPALLPQLPGLVKRISEEHDWLLQLCRREKIDGIISDNRYGLWHPSIPSVILTHQAQILSGMGRLADRMLLRLHRRLLSRFAATWVVDVEGPGNLGGRMSQVAADWTETSFIGWLTQFSEKGETDEAEYILVLLSGPEPQRTMLSDQLWAKALNQKQKVVFVEGKPDAKRSNVPDHIVYYTQTLGGELQALIQHASYVICRSGYSTLMDLLFFKKPALLIPTPGQTEQEYLAKDLSDRGFFESLAQDELMANDLFERQTGFFFPVPMEDPHNRFREVLDEWLNRL
jgi:UDP-N-acetylglucosamine transferase subunit ALG13